MSTSAQVLPSFLGHPHPCRVLEEFPARPHLHLAHPQPRPSSTRCGSTAPVMVVPAPEIMSEISVEATWLKGQPIATLHISPTTTLGAFKAVVAAHLPGQAADCLVPLLAENLLSDDTRTLAQCGVTTGAQMHFLLASGAPQQPAGMLSLEIKTLKGQRISDVVVSPTDTVAQLKSKLSDRLHGQAVGEMKLLYRAKYLSDETKTLQQYGVKTGTQVHLVSRFIGGKDRTAAEEVAHQLRIVKRSDLPCLEQLEAEGDMSWSVLLRGPADGPYARGLFSLTFVFPDTYPARPPAITFNTPIFHPNVYPTGKVCWSDSDTSGSEYCADVLIAAVALLLEEPNVRSPANSDAASLFMKDRAAFEVRARAVTEQNAFE